MIRINLLPRASRQAATTSSVGNNVWLGAYAASLVFWCIGLGAVYFVYDGRVQEQARKNAALETAIASLKEKSAGLEEVKAQLQKSQKLEEVVTELNRARVGPSKMLLELSKILGPQGPTVDPRELEQLTRDNPLAGFNRNWDARRLWIEAFEEEKRECKIRGKGKTNEDVAEFLRRLALSSLFGAVTLQRTEASPEQGPNLSFIGFEVTCTVEY